MNTPLTLMQSSSAWPSLSPHMRIFCSEVSVHMWHEEPTTKLENPPVTCDVLLESGCDFRWIRLWDHHWIGFDRFHRLHLMGTISKCILRTFHASLRIFSHIFSTSLYTNLHNTLSDMRYTTKIRGIRQRYGRGIHGKIVWKMGPRWVWGEKTHPAPWKIRSSTAPTPPWGRRRERADLF